MSYTEITNLRSRKPVCWAVETNIGTDGYTVAHVVEVYPGDDLVEAIHRDNISLSFKIYDTRGEAERATTYINVLSDLKRENFRKCVEHAGLFENINLA